jgi:hypothetical protein
VLWHHHTDDRSQEKLSRVGLNDDSFFFSFDFMFKRVAHTLGTTADWETVTEDRTDWETVAEDLAVL